MRPDNSAPGSSAINPREDALARQLDALLSQRQAGLTREAGLTQLRSLDPLLDAADALAPLADARPSDAFASQLESRLLARVESRALTLPEAPVAGWLRRRTARLTGAPRPSRAGRRAQTVGGATWAAVAAAVLLALTVGALTASAHPGAPFYSLRRTIEGLSAALSNAPATTAQSRLQRASADLARFNAAASQGDDTSAQAALSQLMQDDQQASAAIAQVSDASERASLQRQLDSFHAQEAASLRTALPGLGWTTRVPATSALRALNATTLEVTSAQIGGAENDANESPGQEARGSATTVQPADQITITLTGQGFTSGATLYVNGQQSGVVVSVTSSTVIARLAPGAVSHHITSVGVSEPDGEAASTTNIQSGEDEASGTPEAGGNATPDPQGSPSTTRTPDH